MNIDRYVTENAVRQIADYWAERGYEVRVFKHGPDRFTTDMKNGLPRKLHEQFVNGEQLSSEAQELLPHRRTK